MRVGVISDTHGHQLNTLDAIRVLRTLKVERVIHCGDIGSADIPPLFTDWPTSFVFGNVDRDQTGLRLNIEAAGHESHGKMGMLDLAGRAIAFLHGDDTSLLRQTIKDSQWNLVCYGHTHRAEFHFDGSTVVLNPGAVYRAKPHTFAIVDLADMNVEIVPF